MRDREERDDERPAEARLIRDLEELADRERTEEEREEGLGEYVRGPEDFRTVDRELERDLI